MRGGDRQQSKLFSYVSPETRVPVNHPLRAIRKMTDAALEKLSGRFDELYSRVGRPSIAPEQLLRTQLLQVLYSVRSERLMMEQLNYNMLFRWFVGLSIDDEVWDPTVFTKNRDRLLEGDVAREFFNAVVAYARYERLLSDEHFTVDGTLIEAWAGHKSFRPKVGGGEPRGDGGSRNPGVDFHGHKRSNDTHESSSDPQARLYRKAKGRESRLSYLGHVLMDNREGLVVDTRVSEANGSAEVMAALEMIEQMAPKRRVTIGADKGYDTQAFVEGMRFMGSTPHVAQNTSRRRSRVDRRTTRHEGYAISQVKRKRIEEIFGWLKTVGLLRKTRHRGKARVGWMFTFAAAAYNLIRIRNLCTASP